MDCVSVRRTAAWIQKSVSANTSAPSSWSFADTAFHPRWADCQCASAVHAIVRPAIAGMLPRECRRQRIAGSCYHRRSTMPEKLSIGSTGQDVIPCKRDSTSVPARSSPDRQRYFRRGDTQRVVEFQSTLSSMASSTRTTGLAFSKNPPARYLHRWRLLRDPNGQCLSAGHQPHL